MLGISLIVQYIHFQLHAGYLIKCPILNSPYSSSNCELCSVISISVVDTITQTPKLKHWDQLRFLHSVLFPIKFLRSFQFHLSFLSVSSFSLATTATTSDSSWPLEQSDWPNSHPSSEMESNDSPTKTSLGFYPLCRIICPLSIAKGFLRLRHCLLDVLLAVHEYPTISSSLV